MKSRFSTLDIKAALKEVQENLVDHYVLNIYDIDSKTYLIKLRNKDSKKILLLESGGRIHPTEMEWPKSAGKFSIHRK
jgi:predicted ribosome quality control (RQC) complex YloA/Tae2 family protein